MTRDLSTAPGTFVIRPERPTWQARGVNRVPRLPICAIALVVSAGCSSADEPVNDCVPVTSIGMTVQPVTCPVYECGSNSAEINDLPIGELHITPGNNTGQVNSWNARMIDFIAPDGSRDYVIKYEDGHLLADGPRRLEGPDLIGSQIIVRNEATCEELALHFQEIDRTESWTDEAFLIDRYLFTFYDERRQGHRPICTDADEMLGESAWSVLVAEERYKWETKEIHTIGEDARGWFNIACYGNALYKMKFMGYDPNPSLDNPYSSLPEDRQATLKMLTADYCGTGESFTETGTALYWLNAEGWSDNAVPPNSTFEAYWNGAGALCLDMPRLGLGQRDAIEQACAGAGRMLPLCDAVTGPYVWESWTPTAP